jgi:hypothetical protein
VAVLPLFCILAWSFINHILLKCVPAECSAISRADTAEIHHQARTNPTMSPAA